jgi:transcriptional regulator with XRE-family HTH domain
MEIPAPPEHTFGQTIHAARQRAGLSFAHAAGQIGISKSLLHLWESDQTASPDRGAVMRLATLLDIDQMELIRLAGYDAAETLPTVQPYFRNKYPDLPEAAISEIAAITKKYGIDPDNPGPRPGEDEH